MIGIGKLAERLGLGIGGNEPGQWEIGEGRGGEERRTWEG
jgi:hypothetical protein